MRRGGALAQSVRWVAAMALVAAAAAAQAPPPKPPAGGGAAPQEEPERPRPAPRPPILVPQASAPPPPVLVLTADMDCSVELDGEVIGRLQKDVVQEFTVRAGEHLLQAFPDEVEGPTWKETVKAPDTGRVVAVIELRDAVDEWQEDQQNLDRFTIADSTVTDNETGMTWTRNVSPEMKWQDIVGYCERLRTDGVGGWRLPTIDELSKLYHPDHPAPRQETTRPDVQWTIFGRKRGEMEVQPRLIFEPFDHNSVSGLWVMGAEERVMCSFLGEFTCALGSKKEMAGALCVRAAE